MARSCLVQEERTAPGRETTISPRAPRACISLTRDKRIASHLLSALLLRILVWRLSARVPEEPYATSLVWFHGRNSAHQGISASRGLGQRTLQTSRSLRGHSLALLGTIAVRASYRIRPSRTISLPPSHAIQGTYANPVASRHKAADLALPGIIAPLARCCHALREPSARMLQTLSRAHVSLGPTTKSTANQSARRAL